MVNRKTSLCLIFLGLALSLGSASGQPSAATVKDALSNGKISLRVDAVSGGKELAVTIHASGEEPTRVVIPKGTTTFALDLGSTVEFSFSLVASDAIQVEVAPKRDFSMTFSQAQGSGIATGGMNLENRDGKAVAFLERGLTLAGKGATVTVEKPINVLMK